MHFLFTEQVVLETLQLTLIILDVREDAELSCKEWTTDKRCYALIPIKTIIRGSHHHKSMPRCK